MHGKLAVADASLNLLAVLALPDLTIVQKARMPFRPGKLCASGALYCADAEGPSVHVLDKATLSHSRSFATGPEIEALASSANGLNLYVLSGGADSLQMLDASHGRLLNIASAGMRPRGLSMDAAGQHIAVACGDTADVRLLDAQTLSMRGSLAAGGPTVAVHFFAGQLMALCSAGDYDMGSIVGAFGSGGKWCPWAALPGMPSAMAPCGGGLLIGHHMGLTMLDPPNGRIRWQTKIPGLPTEIVPIGRVACFADALDGTIGVVDLRRGTILRRLRVPEPTGLVAL